MLCELVLFALVNCSRVEQYFARAPTEHRALVRSVEVRGRPCTGQANWRRGRIRFAPCSTEQKTGRLLLHELGHLVSHRDNHRLLRAWREQFWRRGRPRGPVVRGYSRKSPGEDFADAYAAYLLDELRCCPERARWLRAQIFRGR